MMENMQHDLIALSDLFGSHAHISHWRVFYRVTGNGQFFNGLRQGRSCTLKTASKVVQWFSDHWPEDLEWPEDIPRPPKSGGDEG